MQDREPNNRPWVILGGVCGLIILGVLGLGVYSGTTYVAREASVDLPEPPKKNTQVNSKNVAILHVDETDRITFAGKELKDLKELASKINLMDQESKQSTVFILRISDQATHRSLVDIKNLLDSNGLESKIEIMRAASE